MKTAYKLYTYDVWGNQQDGYEVNDIYAQPIVVHLPDSPTNRQINRALHARGLVWEEDYADGSTLYAETKRGRPICELRRVEGL